MIVEHGPSGARAVFSSCRRYRYELRRVLVEPDEGEEARTVVFVMLNPSTADAFQLDPTVKRCARFAMLWGFHVLEVVNLFAYRSPRPADLYMITREARPTCISDALGADLDNDRTIISRARGADRVIAAWGNHGEDPRLYNRGQITRARLELAGVELWRLGLTKGGAPVHPLARGHCFVPYDRKPVRWAA